MPKRARKDGNHNAIVKRFRDLGCSVLEHHGTGIAGEPDLAVGVISRTFLVEIKDPSTHYGRSGLNANQSAFARDWRGGKVYVVTSEDEATALVQNWLKYPKEDRC